MYSLSRRVGLRGDLRYFRAFVDGSHPDDVMLRNYGFWRTVIGVTLGLPHWKCRRNGADRQGSEVWLLRMPPADRQ